VNARPLSFPIACPDCDLLQRLPSLPPGAKGRCRRCGRALAKRPSTPGDLALALAITAAIVYVLANVFPLMDLSVVGRVASTTIAGGAYEMWNQGELITGVIVAFCAVIAPGGYVLFMLTLLLAARRSPPPPWVAEMLRWVRHFEIWAMLEVMMLGILVALIKIAELATVNAGIGMYAFGALVFLCPAIMLSFDDRELWQRVQWADGEMPLAATADGARSGPAR
jgi:paraquat-inducible protein A